MTDRGGEGQVDGEGRVKGRGGGEVANSDGVYLTSTHCIRCGRSRVREGALKPVNN